MTRPRRPAPAGTATAYLRVSTEEQADSGAGLDAQRAAIETEAARRGWTIIAWHVDAGVSGKSLNRPALMEALADVREGRAASLVVAKLDRLSRSLLDFAGVMADAQRAGWNLVALDLGLDLSTPSGEMMASIMAVYAQFERRLIGQRTSAALAAKRAAGVRRTRCSGPPSTRTASPGRGRLPREP
jgi:DNA invertase Pin-like site-specific DNA recombinase